jgi:hypothetical protein
MLYLNNVLGSQHTAFRIPVSLDAALFCCFRGTGDHYLKILKKTEEIVMQFP